MIFCGRLTFSSIFKMASTVSIDRIKQNAEVARQTIIELKSELSDLNATYNSIRARQLKEENAQLMKAVEEARQRLIQLESRNGVQQVPLPQSSTVSCTSESKPQEETVIPKTAKGAVQGDDNKPKKEKKAKEPKQKEKTPAAEELPVDIGRLDLRIAKVEDVQRHPDADSLYVLKINCGEEKPRTVCSGLVKHVPIEELRDRSVMLLCNLKPVKMRGITSEAMVMCASTAEKVEVLSPPFTCSAGELVHCTGYERHPDPVMNPKKKIFETVAPDLHTNDSFQACYKGVPLSVPNKGEIVSKTLKNVPVK